MIPGCAHRRNNGQKGTSSVCSGSAGTADEAAFAIGYAFPQLVDACEDRFGVIVPSGHLGRQSGDLRRLPVSPGPDLSG